MQRLESDEGILEALGSDSRRSSRSFLQGPQPREVEALLQEPMQASKAKMRRPVSSLQSKSFGRPSQCGCFTMFHSAFPQSLATLWK